MIAQKYKDYFRGKKITVMGLGLLGRGLGDVAFLAECGAELLVTDLKTADELKTSLSKLKKFKNIKYVLGEHRMEDFQTGDMVLKANDVSLDNPYIAEAKKNGIRIAKSGALFAELSGVPIIGITGTRGKSTVTHMIAHILEKSGRKILLGGNIVGVSNLQLLKDVKDVDYAVMELDSWQLQGFGDFHISPHVAVFTTFFPDHLKYYGGSMHAYFADKAKIFLYQNQNDILIVGKQAYEYVGAWKERLSAKVIKPSEKLPKGFETKLIGKHNEYNASLAVATVRALGIKDGQIKKALKTFAGVEGRLELVKSVGGVKYYNDTTSTTPEALMVALKSLSEIAPKKIILIMGGHDKALDMSEVVKSVPKYCKEVLLLAGSGTEALKPLTGKWGIPMDEFKDLKSAFGAARASARRGDVVLLSPGFASFGMFKNEFDRGEQFNRLVGRL